MFDRYFMFQSRWHAYRASRRFITEFDNSVQYIFENIIEFQTDMEFIEKAKGNMKILRNHVKTWKIRKRILGTVPNSKFIYNKVAYINI